MMLYTLIKLTFSILWALLQYFALVFALTLAWRAYTIYWSRRRKRPVRAKETVLITGATSGIGLALAKHLWKLGYSIIVAYYDDREPGFEELKRLMKNGNKSDSSPTHNKNNSKHQQQQQRMIFTQLDVRSETSIARAYDQCAESLREHNLELYALVNNAGRGSLQPFAWLQRRTIKSLVDTNLLGAMLVTREFLPLLAQARGRLVMVSSGLGLVPGSTYATYGTTKAALIYLTRSLNLELAQQYGVRSVAVLPHNFIKNTAIVAHNVKNNEDAWQELKPIERRLYESEFRQHTRRVKSLEEARSKLASLASSSSRASDEHQRQRRQWGPLSWLAECLGQLFGESVALSLEQSGALECFEDALRLREPPELIFAGDHSYSLLVGSLLLSIPTSFAGLLSSSVSPSLYR